MKKYIKASYDTKITSKYWFQFIDKIERFWDYQVESPERYEAPPLGSGTCLIYLLDSNGNEYEAEVTCYSDGYELQDYNIHEY